jgi:hypothetical protein
MNLQLDDPDFKDFNLCYFRSPDLRAGGGPNESQLFRLVYESRKGVRGSTAEFADTMYWTLRPAAYESFQKLHGPRAIDYRDWFFSKLCQFFGILLYEQLRVFGLGAWGGTAPPQTDEPWNEGCGVLCGDGPSIDRDELEELLSPEDNANEEINWGELVFLVAGASENRLVTLREWLQRIPKTPASTQPPGRHWVKNAERDQIILNCLMRKMERQAICEELDRRTIPPLPSLQKTGFVTWVKAWDDPEGRETVQRLFSKLLARQKAVKPPRVSKHLPS